MKYCTLLTSFMLWGIVFCSVEIVDRHGGEEGPDHDHEEMDGFDLLVNETNSPMEGKLNRGSVEEILHRLNEPCLSTDHLFSLLGLNFSEGLTEEQFSNASYVIIHYMLQKSEEGSCPGALSDLQQAKNLFRTEEVCRSNVAMLIKNITEVGKFESGDNRECFGSATLLSGCTSNQEELNEVVSNLVISMARGLCLLPEPSYFQNELFEYFNSEGNSISQGDFTELLEKFNIGEVHEAESGHGHGEEEEHGHSHGEEHGHEEGEEHGDEDDHDHDEDEENHDEEGDHHDDDDEDHDEEGEDHDDDNDHDEEGENHDDEDENHLNGTHASEHGDEHKAMKKCYTSAELLRIAGNERDADGNLILTKEGLAQISPAILQQFVSNACVIKHEESTRSSVEDTYTQDKKYGFGTLAVLIISLSAFGGLLLFPSIGSVSFKLTMQFFIALGIGTLSGDALLHIIPEVVGLHSHGAGDSHDHDHSEDEDQTYLFKLLAVIGGIYLFYLFENIIRLYNQIAKKNISLHQHHHDDHKHAHTLPGRDHATNRAIPRMSIDATIDGAPNGADFHDISKIDEESNSENGEKLNTVCCGVTPVGIMVFIGDALHNFGDGLALGVAFSTSLVSGIGTSIAIFCHELPHEFGDFAIYMKNGMSKWQALGMNFLAACCAFIGLYIGLSVAENEDARQWMLAVIAGMFLYISLVDVLHEMIEEVSEKRPLLMFLLQNVGLCLGWAILLILAMYEDQLRNILH